MERLSHVVLAFSAGLCAGGVQAGDGKITIVRPGPCAAQTSYLLAENSGALIQAPQQSSALSDHIIVFRPNADSKPLRGWASRHLLHRFDLQLEEEGVRIVNSGAFCLEER